MRQMRPMCSSASASDPINPAQQVRNAFEPA
jgi:hypothetical protein